MERRKNKEGKTRKKMKEKENGREAEKRTSRR